MDNIGDLVLLDEFHVAVAIGDIELLKLAREVKLLSADIAGDHILCTKLLADGVGEWDSNLSLAASKQYLAVLPRSLLLKHGGEGGGWHLARDAGGALRCWRCQLPLEALHNVVILHL